MAASGSSSALEYSSETDTSARIAGAKVSLQKRPASTTSFPKRVAVPMTIQIWSRCAGPAIERKQQQREPDEEFQN